MSFRSYLMRKVKKANVITDDSYLDMKTVSINFRHYSSLLVPTGFGL